MDQDIPVGFLGFLCDLEFSQATSYCSDFDLDVLEIHVCGLNFLVFFRFEDFQACIFFSELENFDTVKFVFS